MKKFRFGELVRVALPKKKPFTGHVYSEYTNPGMMRRICVMKRNGSGVGYPVMYVNKIRSK